MVAFVAATVYVLYRCPAKTRLAMERLCPKWSSKLVQTIPRRGKGTHLAKDVVIIQRKVRRFFH